MISTTCLSSPLPRHVTNACQTTEQVRPWFQERTQIQFHCSNIYHFVCFVSACSLTKAAIVPEGHSAFLLLQKSSVLHTEREGGGGHYNNQDTIIQMRRFGLQSLVLKRNNKEKRSWLHFILNWRDTPATVSFVCSGLFNVSLIF